MATFGESIRRAARRVFCRVAGASFRVYERTLGDGNPNSGFNPFRGAYSLACDLPPPPEPTPTFPPGRCAVQYTAKVTTIRDVNGTDQTESVTRGCGFLGGNEIFGPVEGFEIEPLNGRVVCRCTDGAGNPRLVGMSSSSPFTIKSFSVDFLSRCDGQPDDCGEPIPPPPPPTDPPPPETEPVTYDDPDGNPVIVPVTFAFGLAYIGVDFNVHVPVDIDVDFDVPVHLRADFNLNTGDFNFNFGDPASPAPPSGGGGGQPGSYDTPAPRPPLPPDQPPTYTPPEYEEDMVETETILRGVIVRITQLPQNANVWFNDQMPDLYYPRLGNVSFYVRVGNSFAWTEFISITSKQQIIMCPWEGGAVDVKAHFYEGVNGQLYPVYRFGEKGYSFSLQ